MKKMGAILTCAGIIGAGVVGYCMMNKDTKRNADKLLNTVLEDANNKMKKMK